MSVFLNCNHSEFHFLFKLKTEAWSKVKEKKEKRKQKKEGRSLKALKRKAEPPPSEDEEDDFGDDLRLMKKLKKGKVIHELTAFSL